MPLTGSDGPTPSLTTPFVGGGGLQLTYQLTVQDEYGGVATDTVVVRVQNANDPPLASAARPTIACIWPPNHGLVQVGIVGVSDANDNATISATRSGTASAACSMRSAMFQGTAQLYWSTPRSASTT